MYDFAAELGVEALLLAAFVFGEAEPEIGLVEAHDNSARRFSRPS
ncbi:hypothetical protein [Propionicimonas paludicola]|nr:hypothetical protein [Propionicimonas paludicola]